MEKRKLNESANENHGFVLKVGCHWFGRFSRLFVNIGLSEQMIQELQLVCRGYLILGFSFSDLGWWSDQLRTSLSSQSRLCMATDGQQWE